MPPSHTLRRIAYNTFLFIHNFSEEIEFGCDVVGMLIELFNFNDLEMHS